MAKKYREDRQSGEVTAPQAVGPQKIKIMSKRLGPIEIDGGQVIRFEEVCEVTKDQADRLSAMFPKMIRIL